ncbi:MAG: hypothetical protein LCH88_09205 [Proteobacteria bacterium]|nr:hypothetical protein [Pseudomonadota bacterium]
MPRRHVTLVLDLDEAGNPIEINRGWQEDEVSLPTGGLGMTPRVNVDEASLAGVLPDSAAHVSQIAKLNIDLEAANAAKVAADIAKTAAEQDRDEKVETAERDRDGKVMQAQADVIERDATIAQLQASLAALTAPPAYITISDRQFFQALALNDLITQEEAEAAVATGTIPAAMAALVNHLPIEQQFPARMLLKGETAFRSDHPLTMVLAGLYSWTPEQMISLFEAASRL